MGKLEETGKGWQPEKTVKHKSNYAGDQVPRQKFHSIFFTHVKLGRKHRGKQGTSDDTIVCRCQRSHVKSEGRLVEDVQFFPEPGGYFHNKECKRPSGPTLAPENREKNEERRVPGNVV